MQRNVNYDNPNPNIDYRTAAREMFLVSGRPHDQHAHSYHSVDCKQGQFQTDGGGACIGYGLPQDITPIQGTDMESDLLYSQTPIPITSTMTCGPVGVGIMHPYPRMSCQEKIRYGTQLPNNLSRPYPQFDSRGVQLPSRGYPIEETYGRMKTGPFLRQNEVIDGFHSRGEGFHGDWGRGLYDSGLAGRHFVTTTRVTPHRGQNPRTHNEIRTEWTQQSNNGCVNGGICEEPYKYWGDGYNGQYAFMPSGYEYNAYPHPYDNGAMEKYGTYVTDYETGTPASHGPIIAQHLRGPLADKNRLELHGEFRTIHMPGEMSKSDIMHSAYATPCDRRPPTALMYKTQPQGVMETNISIFDNFI